MTDPQDLHELTGAYALDALPEDERQRFEAHLESCERCAREVVTLRATTSRLAELSTDVPPSGLRDRILDEARHTPQERAVIGPAPVSSAFTSDRASDRTSDHRQHSGSARWIHRLTAAAAVVFAIAVIGLGSMVADLGDRLDEAEAIAQRSERSAEQFVELLTAPDANLQTAEGPGGARGRIVTSASRGRALLVTDNLQPAPADHTYQLWLIDEAGARPAGLFDTDAHGRAAQPLTGELADNTVVGVTVEPRGGSPQPTTDPVLAIELH